MAYLNGIDIASYQSTLDLNNINYDFVLVKATEGTSYVNPYCDTHVQEALAAGKKVGVYHFANGPDPIAEANWFVDNCSGYINEALFVLDWEGSGVAEPNWALRFLQQVEARIGYKALIYMSEWVENNYDWSAVAANDNGLWLASYSNYEIANNYDMSGAGQSPNVVHWPFFIMWQWTSKGSLSGYAGDLDCDIFYGDGETWDAYANKKAIPTTTTTTTVETPIENTTTTTTLESATTTTTTTQPEPPQTATTTTTTTNAGTTPVIVPPKPVVIIKQSLQSTVSLGEAVVTRALKTFFQTFLAIFLPTVTGVTTGILNVQSLSQAKALLISTILAAVAAALSAAQNTIQPPKEVTK